MMEEEQSIHGGGVGGGRGGGTDCFLHYSTVINTLAAVPISRYRPRLFSGDRSDDLDQPMAGEIFSYWSPIVILDLIWNLAFVLVSIVVLLFTFREKPSTPLRVWLSGCVFQSLLHVSFVYLDVPSSHYYSSILKRLESLNTMTSSVWWVFGFYWIVSGGQALLQDSPRLYWLTVVFLAFDLFYIIFCIGMACIIFIAIFCCVPIVAIAYAASIGEGASEDDINALPKYRFRHANSMRGLDHNKKHNFSRRIVEPGSNNFAEISIPLEDSECCICLSQYIDGAELNRLPCNHHFHCICISRWLRINATCPLCKFNILRGDSLV